MDFRQFDEHVLSPTLHALRNHMPNPGVAKTLVAETIWHESGRLQYVVQRPNGPAHGVCQMELPTWDDLWGRFLKGRFELRDAIRFACAYGQQPMYPDLTWNLRLAVAMCRLKYFSIRAALPEDTLEARAAYWGRYYQGTSNPTKIAKYVENARAIPWE